MELTCWLTALLLLTAVADAQTAKLPVWEMESSGTTAGLRGIHAVGGGVVWASGERGTVLRTEDSGYMWQSCAMPPGAEKLDFRGVWAWDANNAVVMSSGPGDQSRLYKTTDGCSHWALLYTNPDKDGFWDAVEFGDLQHGLILGDPVQGSFTMLRTVDGGVSWKRLALTDQDASGLGAFAASNSALTYALPVLNSIDPGDDVFWFAGGGPVGAFVFRAQSACDVQGFHANPAACSYRWMVARDAVPLTHGNASSGVFSLFLLAHDEGVDRAVAVGGDYLKPEERAGTAAFWEKSSRQWTAATEPPGGYRSAVACDGISVRRPFDAPGNGYWIAVGPNGSDLSRDGGRTWQSLEHNPSDIRKGGEWNALSLPWVVGPGGRIAKLNPNALPPEARAAKTNPAK